jgi:MerR family transcriptional regulator, copper efflux regulator
VYGPIKLLSPSARRPSGYRVYGEEEERRLRFIKNAQALGFTLHEIGELLDLRGSSKARCSDVQRKAQAKLEQITAKMRDLRARPGAPGLDPDLQGGQQLS